VPDHMQQATDRLRTNPFNRLQRDDKGQDHLVLADMGCRNTVFNAEVQTGLPYLGAFIGSGISSFRVELVDEPGEAVGPLLGRYKEALSALGVGAREAQQAQRALWEWLQQAPGGAGVGSLQTRLERSVHSMKPTAAVLKEHHRR
jgi:putative protease